jgi:hypothetical protein
MSTNPKRSEPVATIKSNPAAWNAWATSEERVPLFSLYVKPLDEDGEPIADAEPELVAYTMPAKPNPGLALKFLKMAREQGELASSWLIESAIGADGYDALAAELINYDGDPVALLRAIVEKIQRVAMGGLEAPKA